MFVASGVLLAVSGGLPRVTAEVFGAEKPAAPKKARTDASEKPNASSLKRAPIADAADLAPTLAPVSTASPTEARPPASISAQLMRGRAGTCAAQVDALAAGTMGGVAQFNTVSNWASTGGDTRGVSVTIGQKYPAGSLVPYGATSVMAAPNGQGGCDAMAIQVVPSPLPCAKLRESLATRGKQIGDLAGVPLMQDGDAQTLLVPTASNTCVLVGLRTAYAG